VIDRSLQKTYRQFRKLWPTLLWAYVPALMVLGGITIFAQATGRRVWYFTNDPFVLGHLPFYAGVLSSLSNLLWGAGATVCFFSALVLAGNHGEKREGRGKEGRWKREEGSNDDRPYTLTPESYNLPGRGKEGRGKKEAKDDVAEEAAGQQWFLFASGLLTSLFLFDDLFQFHRILYIKYLPLSAEAVFAVYGLLALGYIIYFRKEIAGTDYLLLAAALAFFIAAVVFDTVSLLPRGRTAFSDGLKFFGIISWTAYFVRTGRQTLRRE
jgi:hypothetical protein